MSIMYDPTLYRKQLSSAYGGTGEQSMPGDATLKLQDKRLTTRLSEALRGIGSKRWRR